MKKIIVMLMLIVSTLLFKYSHATFLDITASLDVGEIGITFLDESMIMIHLNGNEMILDLDKKIDDNIFVNNLDIIYNGSNFSITYASKKFCVGYFYDCDFVYLYKEGKFNDADVYFYNDATFSLLNDIPVLSYDVDSPISIIWDSKNYIILSY